MCFFIFKYTLEDTFYEICENCDSMSFQPAGMFLN